MQTNTRQKRGQEQKMHSCSASPRVADVIPKSTEGVRLCALLRYRFFLDSKERAVHLDTKTKA